MLSGGERQRVAIARALVKNPDIILADEPTGNLDSKNSLEIMKIIKTISKEKLVILVTHEAELAKFYASRVIEIKDGEIVNDYENNNSKDIDYKIENVFYLKDFDKIDKHNNVNVYMDKDQELKVDIVVHNNNIYIKSNNNYSINVVDSDSSVEFKDEHYKKISVKEIKTDIDYSILNNNFKARYSSILNLFTLIINGFKKIFDYSMLRKILLLGFFFSGMFTFYAISMDEATKIIKDENFVEYNKEYLLYEKRHISVDEYMKIKNIEGVDFVMPTDSRFTFYIYNKEFFQTSNHEILFDSSISPFSILNDSDILLGRKIENSNEIIVDKMIYERINKNVYEIYPKQLGIYTLEDMIGKTIKVNELEFKIVGITDTSSPTIYVDNSMILKIIGNSEVYEYEDESETKIKNIEYESNNISLIKGVNPVNDYEIIVYKDLSETYPLNKEIKNSVNSHRLKVVGYYDSIYGDIGYITSSNTYLYNIIKINNNMIIHSTDKEKTIELLNNQGIIVKDTYTYTRNKYISHTYQSVAVKKLMSYIFLIISLIEIYLMIRSSFFSRIKEVGIYRAIGVKKTDIYKMFMGEIIAITVIACIPGILFMAYILNGITKVTYLGFSSMFVINSYVLFKTLIIISVFNLLVGLLPIFLTILNTPASILARHDLD